MGIHTTRVQSLWRSSVWLVATLWVFGCGLSFGESPGDVTGGVKGELPSVYSGWSNGPSVAGMLSIELPGYGIAIYRVIRELGTP